jgi:hypothetical protein
LDELGTGTYKGFQGGLYPGGKNHDLFPHDRIGVALANAVEPRSSLGTPDRANGKIVFLSIGMSNAYDEFASFISLARSDPLRDPHVLAVNGAEAGQAALDIANPASPYWLNVDRRLADAGASRLQVAAVWLKEADRNPTLPFPVHALVLKQELSTIVTDLKVFFPNLWLVYVSSRIYGGYASTPLNPEPYAYESGFSVKWLIQDQILGLLPVGLAPWLSWGPYLWADGIRSRADGLNWLCEDFLSDGTHLTSSGRTKVAQRLLNFVHSDPTASVWYRP